MDFDMVALRFKCDARAGRASRATREPPGTWAVRVATNGRERPRWQAAVSLTFRTNSFKLRTQRAIREFFPKTLGFNDCASFS